MHSVFGINDTFYLVHYFLGEKWSLIKYPLTELVGQMYEMAFLLRLAKTTFITVHWNITVY